MLDVSAGNFGRPAGGINHFAHAGRICPERRNTPMNCSTSCPRMVKTGRPVWLLNFGAPKESTSSAT